MESDEEKAEKLALQLADLAKQAALRSALEGGRAGAFDQSATMIREAFLCSGDRPTTSSPPQVNAALSAPNTGSQGRPVHIPETRPVHGYNEVVLNILRTGPQDGLFFDEIDKLCRDKGYRRPLSVLRALLTRAVKAGQVERSGDIYRVIHRPPGARHE